MATIAGDPLSAGASPARRSVLSRQTIRPETERGQSASRKDRSEAKTSRSGHRSLAREIVPREAYLGVPRKVPGMVSPERVCTVFFPGGAGPKCLAMPKSSSFVPPVGQNNVLGFQVAVHDSNFVECFERR